MKRGRPASPADAPGESGHSVQFYKSEGELFTITANFLIDGLVASQPAIVIATPPHTVAIFKELVARNIDVGRARRIGDLIALDAEEMLDTFMDRGAPNPVLFRKNLGQVLEQANRGRERTPLRAYGEMADVLWKRGQTDAAIRLEVLWNELATACGFSLRSGYTMGNFYKQTAGLNEIADPDSFNVSRKTHVVGLAQDRPGRRGRAK